MIDKKQVAVNFIEQAKHSHEIERVNAVEIAAWEGLLSSFFAAKSHRVSGLDGNIAKIQGIIRGIQADTAQQEPKQQAEKQLFDWLPENIATLLRMRYLEGYHHKEIMCVLKMARNKYFDLHNEALMIVYDYAMGVSEGGTMGKR